MCVWAHTSSGAVWRDTEKHAEFFFKPHNTHTLCSYHLHYILSTRIAGSKSIAVSGWNMCPLTVFVPFLLEFSAKTIITPNFLLWILENTYALSQQLTSAYLYYLLSRKIQNYGHHTHNCAKINLPPVKQTPRLTSDRKLKLDCSEEILWLKNNICSVCQWVSRSFNLV